MKVLLYRRYVYDTYCLFDNEIDAHLFHDYLNTRHNNMKFTMENEVDKKLPFLDILIDNSNPISPHTSIFQKKNFFWFVN